MIEFDPCFKPDAIAITILIIITMHLSVAYFGYLLPIGRVGEQKMHFNKSVIFSNNVLSSAAITDELLTLRPRSTHCTIFGKEFMLFKNI